LNPAKTAELIDMPFGMWTVLGPRNRALYGGPGPDPACKGAIFMGKNVVCWVNKED